VPANPYDAASAVAEPRPYVRPCARGRRRLRPPHGEAVALGLLAALRLSGRDTSPVVDALDPQPVRVDRDRAWEALQRDKKRSGTAINLVCSAMTGPTSMRDPLTRFVPPGYAHPPLMQVLVLNGANLDALARRDPAVYGGLSLNELESRIYGWRTHST